MRFHFAFEKLLEIRKRTEDLARRDHAIAVANAFEAEAELRRMYEAIDQARGRAAQIEGAGGACAESLGQIDAFIRGQGVRIDRQRSKIRELQMTRNRLSLNWWRPRAAAQNAGEAARAPVDGIFRRKRRSARFAGSTNSRPLAISAWKTRLRGKRMASNLGKEPKKNGYDAFFKQARASARKSAPAARSGPAPSPDHLKRELTRRLALRRAARRGKRARFPSYRPWRRPLPSPYAASNAFVRVRRRCL